ncbi:MAG: ASCH domain-containing protein [Crenarchaeota archaeon]|nr:ASCH domain-containing protein [Thermoproteota archaeon]
MTKIIYLGRHLMLRSSYVKKIMECGVGGITRTIRLGIVKPKFREVFIHSGGKVIAKAEIVRTIYKKVSDLTDEDAKLDGFSSRRELIRELEKIYGKLRPNTPVTILELKILEYLDLSDEDVNAKLSPVEIARLALYYNVPLSEEEKKILKQLTEVGSLRKLAIRLYGTIEKRWIIRKIVRKALKLLQELQSQSSKLSNPVGEQYNTSEKALVHNTDRKM